MKENNDRENQVKTWSYERVHLCTTLKLQPEAPWVERKENTARQSPNNYNVVPLAVFRVRIIRDLGEPFECCDLSRE